MPSFEKFKRGVEARFASKPQDYTEYISDKVPFIRDLNLTPGELSWIANVKKSSEEYMAEQEKCRFPQHLSAFDYIELHLMMLGAERFRDEPFSKRKEYLEKQIDIKSGEIKNAILSDNEQWWKSVESNGGYGGTYESDLYDIYCKLRVASSPQEKLTAITRYLNVVHKGGNREGIPEGFVSKKTHSKWKNFSERRAAQIEFLKNLNELGNPNYWSDKGKKR